MFIKFFILLSVLMLTTKTVVGKDIPNLENNNFDSFNKNGKQFETQTGVPHIHRVRFHPHHLLINQQQPRQPGPFSMFNVPRPSGQPMLVERIVIIRPVPVLLALILNRPNENDDGPEEPNLEPNQNAGLPPVGSQGPNAEPDLIDSSNLDGKPLVPEQPVGNEINESQIDLNGPTIEAKEDENKQTESDTKENNDDTDKESTTSTSTAAPDVQLSNKDQEQKNNEIDDKQDDENEDPPAIDWSTAEGEDNE